MTQTMPEWSDDRLNAAFAARAAGHATPAGLIEDVRTRIAEPVRAPRRGWLAAIAGLAAVIALITVAQLIVVVTPRPSASSPGPDTAAGLPIISVSEALAVRDVEQSDREIAVAGYYAAAPVIRCPASTDPANPTELSCQAAFSWLLESPERLIASTPNSMSVVPPSRPAIHPSMALVDVGNLPQDPLRQVPIVVVGHFHDRRAELCPRERLDECGDTFVVDRIAEVAGAPIATGTLLRIEPYAPETLSWSIGQVDTRLTESFPGLEVLSRVAVTGGRLGEIEPTLGTAAFGLIDQLFVWDVTVLQPSDAGGAPIRRTYLLVDGQDDAYVDDPSAAVRFREIVLRPPVTPPPTESPTPVSAGFGPSEVHGLPVIPVPEALARLDGPDIDDTELAVRGYYVPPFQPTSCPEHPPDITPIRMACPDAFEWLMAEPEQVEDPATLERRAPRGPALNPLVADEIPFDVPAGWFDSRLEPLPVVVVGHFNDRRSGSSDERKRFVVDALAWRAGEEADESPVLLVQPTAAAADVLTRITAELGPAKASWVSVVDGGKLPSIEPDAQATARELVANPATWIVRRLVDDAGRPRVATAFVADGSDRVWSDSLGDCCWLETMIDAELGDDFRLEIADYPDQIRAVRTDELRAGSWISRQGPPETGTIMLGTTIDGPPNELRVSWTGGQCDRLWHLEWGYDDSLFLWIKERDATCRLPAVRREFVLTLDHPVDIEKVTVSNGGAGG